MKGAADDEYKPYRKGCQYCMFDLNQKRPRYDLPNIISDQYTKFIVQSVEPTSEDILMFRLRCADETLDPALQRLQVPIGHHIILRVKSPTRKTIRQDLTTTDHYIARHYCPFRLNSEAFYFDILVHLMPNGSMSNILRNFDEGDECEIKGPYGEFQLPDVNAYSRIVGLACGVAITPVYRVMADVVADNANETRLTLYSCVRNVDGFVLREELMRLRRYWNFESKVYMSNQCTAEDNDFDEFPLSRCIATKLRYGEQVIGRRLGMADIEDAIRAGERKRNGIADKCLVLISGSEIFTQNMLHYLDQLKDKQMQFEYFALK